MTVRRDSIRDQVRRALTERILAGQYPPGERLVEQRIARELGVSQGSVREALRELEASRLIDSTPNRGSRVRVVSQRELREAYLVRALLEEAAAGAAAVAFAADPAGLGELRELGAAIVRHAAAGELEAQAAANAEFHRRIVAAGGNSVLLRTWDSLAFEVRTRVRLSRPRPDPVADARTHGPIVDALSAGDGALAGRLLRAHAELFAPPAEPEDEEAGASEADAAAATDAADPG